MVTKNKALNPNSADKIMLEKTAVNNANENGYLKVRVVTELRNYPISGATVTVYASLEELVPIMTVTTDSMGYAPLITLPVSYNPEIREMDPVYFYTNYNLNATFNYYYPTLIYNIQVFPGITTEFDVNMTPVPSTDPYPEGERQIILPRIPL